MPARPSAAAASAGATPASVTANVGVRSAEPGQVRDPPHAQPRDLAEPGQHPAGERPLVCRDRPHRGHELAPRLTGFRIVRALAVRPPELPEVVDRRERPGVRLEGGRPGLIPIVGRAHLVGGQTVQHGGFPVERPEVRPEPFVDGADQEVGVDGAHVDGAVRGEMHRVDVRERAGRVGSLDDLGDRVDRAQGVRGVAERDQSRPIPEGGLERVEVQGPVLRVDVDRPHHESAVRGDRPPGRDVRLVVERGDHDLVAGVEGGGDGPADVERQGGHVVAELDLAWVAGAEEGRDCGMGGLGHAVARPAGDE